MGESQVAEGVSPTLTVYGRSYCHLCDDMIAALRNLQGRFAFEIRVVDVDSDASLERRFGELVPVLMHGDRELCHYISRPAAGYCFPNGNAIKYKCLRYLVPSLYPVSAFCICSTFTAILAAIDIV